MINVPKLFVPEQCFRLVKQFEGLRLSPYLCPAGIPTIGYGCTHYEPGNEVSMKDGPITLERAEGLLRRHLGLFYHRVERLTKPGLNENQMSALTSLAYNIGSEAFSRSTLLRKVNADPSDLSIGDEFRRWNKATVGGRLVVLPGLAKRRGQEASLYYLPVAKVLQS